MGARAFVGALGTHEADSMGTLSGFLLYELRYSSFYYVQICSAEYVGLVFEYTCDEQNFQKLLLLIDGTNGTRIDPHS